MSRQALGEISLWLFAIALAFLWGLLVTPGTGRKLLRPPPEPPRLECSEWKQIDAIQVPTGEVIGVSRHCVRFERGSDE